MPSHLNRRLGDLFDQEFDVVVVGGGVAGACAAWDGALRGLSVALIDSHDFASGASSNSLKLVHGGLRYVKRFLAREAREAVRERRAWLHIAPQLVEPIPILVPAYRGGIQNRTFVRLLLAANDTVGWDRNRGLPEERAIEGGRLLSRDEVLALAPALGQPNLSGGAIFHDAQIRNTERLVLEIVHAAAAAGAVVANYIEFEGSIIERGRLVGARLRDRISDRTGQLRARALINAAGAAVPLVLQRVIQGAVVPTHRYSLLVNLMIMPRGLRIAVAFNSHDAGDHGTRQLLWVPWRDREIFGTYHRVDDPRASHPAAGQDDITAFIDVVNRALPDLELRTDELVLVHAGRLPLARTDAGSALSLLRRHRVVDHAHHGVAGAVSLISVKYTTARLAAEEAVDLVQQRLGRPNTQCQTARTRLPSSPESVSLLKDRALDRYAHALPVDIIEHLVRTYGQHFERMIAYRDTDANWAERVHAGSPVIRAELVHGIREEMAQNVEDLLYRRTELGARGVVDRDVVDRIAELLARELGTTAAWPVRPPLPWSSGSHSTG